MSNHESDTFSLLMTQSDSLPDPSPDAAETTGDGTHAVVYGPEHHPLTKSQIDEDARKVVYRLQRAGYKAYVVGGGVRDLLLGKTPKDFDISTDATPKEMRNLFRNCRIIGRRFKLAHVYFSGGKTLEVSTFRDTVEWTEGGDGEGGDGGPVESDNIYGTEATDAVRRDLTINALLLDVSTMEIIDYVGGMKDLKDGVVRVIGDPELRFKEDPVRMIRVVRHSARNGFRIERNCWDAIVAHAERLSQCSQVRVFDELKKDLTSGCFLTILSLLGETGLLDHLLPELLENERRLLSAESDFSRCLEIIDDMVAEGHEVSPTVVLVIIAMFTAGDSLYLCDIAERLPDAPDRNELLGACFTRLTVPRKERERIQLLISLWAKVRNTPVQSFKAGSYKRNALLDELITLLEVTSISREDTTRLGMLKALPLPTEGDDSEGGDDHEPRRRRRRHR